MQEAAGGTISLATARAPCAESPHTYSGNSQAWPLRLGVLNHCNLLQCFKFATLKKKNKSISFLLLNFFFILWCALCRSKNYRHVLWGDGLFLQNGMKNIPRGVSGIGMQKCWSSAFVILLYPSLYTRGMHPLLQLIFMIPMVGEGISSYLFLA